MTPYDGEKADVFASTFILLAIYAGRSFETGREEQAQSKIYNNFKEDGDLTYFWKSI